MVWNLLRGIADALSSSGDERVGVEDNPYYAKAGVSWRWKCVCGAHSRGGDWFKADADYNAQRHQWAKGVDHPLPEVYSISA